MAQPLDLGTMEVRLIANMTRLKDDMSEAQRLVQATSAIMQERSETANRSLQRWGQGGRAVVVSAGQQRAALVSLGQQFNDIGVQVSGNTPILQVFVQQVGQVGNALAGLGGIAGTVGRTLSNPFVAAAIAAGSILATMATRSDEAGEAHKRHAKAAKTLEEAITDMNVALGKANATQEQERQLALSNAQQLYEQAKARRENTKAALEQARAAAIIAQQRAAGPGTRGEIAALGAPIALGQVAGLEKEIARQDALIQQAAKNVLQANLPLLQGKVNEAVDKVARATAAYDRQLASLNGQYAAGKIGSADYVKQLEIARRALDDVKNEDKNAAAAKREHAAALREHNKELREQEKAARAAKAAQDELNRLFDEVQGKYDPATKALRDYGKALDDIEKLRKAGMLNDNQAFDFGLKAGGLNVDALADIGKVDTSGLEKVGDHLQIINENMFEWRDLIYDVTELGSTLFKRNSDGYKAMEKAQRAYRAVELALSIKSMVQDALFTTSSVANSGVRAAADASAAAAKAAATTPFPASLAAIAAVLAALAAVGVKAVGGGGGGAKPAAPNEGKGTVLGDSDAQSQSLTRAIQALQDIDTLTLNVSRDMLTSLRAIETNIGGLSSLIVRTGDVNASAGVKTGFKSDALGSTLSTILTGGGLLGGVPIIGDILGGIGGVIKSLFGSKTTVTGSGIFGGSQSLADILGGGFDASYYSDVKKTKKFFGISTGSKYSTQFTDASDEIEDQFTQILSGFYKAIEAASGPLGVATNDIQKRLDSFVVSIGKIDLQGLTGEEINDKLTAVFGAAADNIAKAAIPGLERFQKVGEGYFETVARVASTVEALGQSFGRLGTNAQHLSVDAAVNLADIFGSASDAASAANAFFEAYYTEAEQTAAKTAQLGKVFESLGLTMPDTLASFRSLVEAQDLTTAAGQQTYATLLQLAPAFADLQGAMQDAASAAAILREREDLHRQLLELQGDESALRALDLSQLDASNRALQEQIYALKDQQEAAQAAAQAEQALASQRLGLENQILQLTGDTAEIRRRELEALDPSLRALQQRIYDLQDEQAAQQAAAQAAQEAAQQAQQLADAWRSVGDSILDEVNRIRRLTAANDNGNFATLLGRFNAANTAARGGDQTAAQSLTGLSQTLLEAAAATATSRQELDRIRASAAAELERTYAVIQAAIGGAPTQTGFGSGSSSAPTTPAWWGNIAASGGGVTPPDSASAAEVKQLRSEIADLKDELIAVLASINGNTGRVDERIKRAQQRSSDGQAFAIEDVSEAA